MSTDSQGRPLSDDGQWAWSGTEWVPAVGGSQPPEPQDMGATIIAPSPFAGGVPVAPAGEQPPYAGTPQPPQGGTPSFGAPFPGYGAVPGAAATPGYGDPAAGYGGAASYGTPPQQKSRKPLLLGLIGVLVVAAVAVALVFVLGGGSKKKNLAGVFTCTVAGQSETGKVGFTGSDGYTVSGGSAGTYTRSGDALTFTSGSFAKGTAVFDSSANTLKILFEGQPINCKK